MVELGTPNAKTEVRFLATVPEHEYEQHYR